MFISNLTHPLLVGVTSENALKINSVINAYNKVEINARVSGYTADSKIGEQPVNEDTLIGARNRIISLKKEVFGLDRIISIENGIFLEEGKWIDRAVVVLYVPKSKQEIIEYSKGVEFPRKYVDMARELGFQTTTVGEVMEKEGFVTNKKDPHLSISGISREIYLEETVLKLVKAFEAK